MKNAGINATLTKFGCVLTYQETVLNPYLASEIADNRCWPTNKVKKPS